MALLRVSSQFPPIKSDMPEDRDYIFQGQHPMLSMYSYLVDANFAYVEAVNDTPHPQTLARRCRIGTLSEADIPMAYAVAVASASMPKGVGPSTN
jgi:hypothetical protein